MAELDMSEIQMILNGQCDIMPYDCKSLEQFISFFALEEINWHEKLSIPENIAWILIAGRARAQLAEIAAMIDELSSGKADAFKKRLMDEPIKQAIIIACEKEQAER